MLGMESARPTKWMHAAAGAGIGAVYGLLLRLLSQSHNVRSILPVMSIAFIFLLPFGMGIISVLIAERRAKQSGWIWIFLPWVSVAAGSLATLLLLIEGWICVVMYLPIALTLASIGGVIGGAIGRSISSHRSKNVTMACVAFIPLLLAPWEYRAFGNQQLRTVENSIDIHADAATVWRNIERVPAIQKSELQSSWSTRIGFPDPVEATLSYEGVGGVRHATFERGVLFIENVDVWEPQKRLAFSIHAQNADIPKTTLDEHVTVGGEFFDVLRGEYDIEQLPSGVVRLHLSSEHRVSTDFNWYAHLWTDAVMADLQQRILHVIQKRCEDRPERS
jgi:hypothetical protein